MMKRYFSVIRNIISTRKIPIIIAFLLIILVPFVIFILPNKTSISKTDTMLYSILKKEDGRTYISLTSKDKYLYKAQNMEGFDAITEFLKVNPVYDKAGVLFPDNFSKNVELKRMEKDSSDAYLKKNNISITNEHYFLDQKINGIPVYNAAVVVHLKNKNEIYAVSGNISVGKIQTKQKITEQQAIQAALTQANKEMPTAEKFIIKSRKKYYVNKKLLGLADDPVDHFALDIIVNSAGTPVLFNTEYLIDLETGGVLYKESQIRDALDRNIYSCSTGSCLLARQEGSSPVGDNDVDGVYTYFGNVYDYYFSTFGRNSYDNKGASYNGYVHVPSGLSLSGNVMRCPNAFWDGYEMAFCSGLAVLDVTGHELTHAVTSNTARLQYVNQSGALNESISDIFGSAMDNNWTMGEGSSLGIIRSMSNPPSYNQPDRLFSSLYYCGQSDHGGVHRNSGIINKTFYLMTDGGSFNGCSVSGIGRVMSHPIMYQALTKYLTPTSNFKDTYVAVMQACGDLNGGQSSAVCRNVENALQATEMDQQPDGSQSGATCQNIPRQIPVCAGGSPLPTDSVTPTVTLDPTLPAGVTPTITSAPARYTINVHVYNDNNNNTQEDSGDTPYQGATVNITGPIPSASGVTDSSGNKSFTNLLSGNYSIRVTAPSHSAQIWSGFVNGNLNLAARFTNSPSLTPPVIVTQPITPILTQAPTVTPTLTPAPTSGGGGGGVITPMPTPQATYNCKEDSSCTSQEKNLHLCSLICTRL